MGLVIGKNFKPRYTALDIMETSFPDIWVRANKTVDILDKCQRKALQLLPTMKTNLPVDIAQLEKTENLINLLHYVSLRSIYVVTKNIRDLIVELCSLLAENENDRDVAEDLQQLLEITFEKFDNVGDLVDEREIGLFKLQEKFKSVSEKCDALNRSNYGFSVGISHDYIIGQWTLTDVIGKLCGEGLYTGSKEFLKDAVNDSDPVVANIEHLEKDEKLNKLIRIY